MAEEPRPEEVEFKKREPSLSQSSDRLSWRASDRGAREKQQAVTVVNQINLKRRDSEIIRTAKENLKKLPTRSSLKSFSTSEAGLTTATTMETVDTMSPADSGRDLLEASRRATTRRTPLPPAEGSAASNLSGGASSQRANGDSEGTGARSLAADKIESHRLKRTVSFCQEVILIQYTDPER